MNRIRLERSFGSALAWWAVVLSLVTTIAGCGAGGAQDTSGTSVAEIKPVALSAGEKLTVVATTNIVGDVVSHVGGDQINLTTLMGVGIDPHSYVPTPADTAAIHDADVVFISGAGLEVSLEKTIESTGGDAAVIHLADALDLLPSTQAHEGEEEVDAHGDLDPHVWFSVPNVTTWAGTVEQTLTALDPAHAESYRTNAEAYAQELKALDAWIFDQVALIPEENRKLVTNHPVFGYFAQRYGLEQIGAVYPINPSAEPSARDIAQIEDTIRAFNVPAVFTESTVNPRLAQQIADDTGVQLVTLYTGSLGGTGSGAESYVEMMRYDVNAIVDALR